MSTRTVSSRDIDFTTSSNVGFFEDPMTYTIELVKKIWEVTVIVLQGLYRFICCTDITELAAMNAATATSATSRTGAQASTNGEIARTSSGSVASSENPPQNYPVAERLKAWLANIAVSDTQADAYQTLTQNLREARLFNHFRVFLLTNPASLEPVLPEAIRTGNIEEIRAALDNCFESANTRYTTRFITWFQGLDTWDTSFENNLATLQTDSDPEIRDFSRFTSTLEDRHRVYSFRNLLNGNFVRENPLWREQLDDLLPVAVRFGNIEPIINFLDRCSGNLVVSYSRG